MTDQPELFPIADICPEVGAEELAASPGMEPYMRFLMAVMAGSDPTPQLEEIARLPLEKRYVWRIASALKWGFVDFDDLSVKADRETLTPEQMSKVRGLVRLRPMQFGMFLKALLGSEEMEQLMGEALNAARQL